MFNKMNKSDVNVKYIQYKEKTMQISKEIIEVLDHIGNKFGLAIDWSSENVMPYIEQLCSKYISWEIATSIACIAISILALTVIGILEKITDGDWGFFAVAFVTCLTIIGCQVFDIIECKVFPEKAIFEYIQNYITNHL